MGKEKKFIEKYRGYTIYLEDNEYTIEPKPIFRGIYARTIEEIKLWIDYVKEREALEDLIKKDKEGKQ